MKKERLIILSMVFALGLVTSNLYGQSVYVTSNLGYGISAGAQGLSSNYTEGTNSYTIEGIYSSFGKGLTLGGAFGYMVNKNIGAELGISYLLGGKTKSTSAQNNGTSEGTFKANMLRINPTFIIASGLEGINPYAKFGMIIGSGSISIEENEYQNDGDEENTKIKLNGGLAIGYNAAVGAMYSLNSKMSLFGELTMVNMTYAPTKGELTKATFNGIDQLPTMTTRDKEMEFVESYTYDSNNPPSEDEPDQDLKQKTPFGSFGINFGLRINL
jgi:hypothetical protein